MLPSEYHDQLTSGSRISMRLRCRFCAALSRDLRPLLALVILALNLLISLTAGLLLTQDSKILTSLDKNLAVS